MYYPSFNLVARGYEDFATAIDPRVTVSRTSTGYRRTTTGLLSPVAAGVARIDYPLAGGSPGWLVEQARTNLVPYSEQIDQWPKNGVTITANASVAPDGNATADKMVEGTTSGTKSVYNALSSIVSGTTYTESFYVKPSERTKVQLSLQLPAVVALAVFDLAAVTYTLASGVAAGIEALPGGWRRIWLTGTATGSGAGAYDLELCNASGSPSYVGDGSSGVYVWGYQFEAGAFPTSYIPTAAAQVSRAADLLSIPVASIPDFSSLEGTLFVQAVAPPLSNAGLAQLDGGTLSNRVGLFYSSSGLVVGVVSNGGTSTGAGSAAVAPGALIKAAIAFTTSGLTFAVNGTVVGSISATVPVSALTTLRIGNDSSNPACTAIQQQTYWPRALASADLQTITA